MASLRDTLANLVEQYKASDTPLANLMRGDKEGAKQSVANALQQATQDPYSGLNVLGTTKLVGKTAQELAHELAQKNAVEMLGLHPENTAMDRAKALGFNVDEPVYHGTGADIKEFNTNNIGQFGKGAYFTNQPGYASKFAVGNLYKINMFSNAPREAYPNVVPAYLRYKKPYMVDYSVEEPTATYLKRNKYDAIIHRGGVFPDNKEYNEFVALSPEQIRSPFAAFDPAKVNEPDLLAGAMALPIATDKDKRNKIIDLLKNK